MKLIKHYDFDADAIYAIREQLISPGEKIITFTMYDMAMKYKKDTDTIKIYKLLQDRGAYVFETSDKHLIINKSTKHSEPFQNSIIISLLMEMGVTSLILEYIFDRYRNIKIGKSIFKFY